MATADPGAGRQDVSPLTRYGSGMFNPANPMPWSTGPGTVQATGGGPGGAAWQNDLAIFGGGLSLRPSGGLYLNPSSNNPWGTSGSPLGFGNAPLFGSTGALGAWGWTPANPSTMAQAPHNIFVPGMGLTQLPPGQFNPYGAGAASTTNSWAPGWTIRPGSQGGRLSM